MKTRLFIFFTGSLIIFPLLVTTQTTWLEIPLGLEEHPTGRDSFIPYYQLKRPKIAFALSGGGARGLAQIGVLKVFEKHGLSIDGIAGTSMGAIIGGLFSAGYSADEIDSLAQQIQWNEIIQDTPPRRQLFLGQKEEKARYILQLRLRGLSLDIPSAITAGQKLTVLITDLVLNAPHPVTTDFDNMRIPFRAVATDLLSGKKIVLKEGSLVDALRASMAIPLLFAPVFVNNTTLVDGGLVQNLPVSEARSLGADLIIAVDTSSKLRNKHSLKAPWEIADQATTIMQQERIRSQLKEADIFIQPSLDGISNTDFDQIHTIIRAGEEAAEKQIQRIEELLTQNLRDWTNTFFQVKKISLSGCRKLNTELFLSKISIDTTSLISLAQIVWLGRSLLQTGYFETVSTFVDTSSEQLIFRVKENPFVKKINISGNTVFSDSVLFSIMESSSDEVLNTQKGKQDLRRLMRKYHCAGYALARIDTICMDGETLEIKIDEGRISRIKLVGNKQTRPFVILRELPLKPGDLFNVSLLRKGIENIYSSGYFEGVRFNIERKNGNRNLILHLIEQGYTLLSIGLRYDLERRTQGLLQVVQDNLMGFGGKASIVGLVGKRDEMIQASFRADRLFNTFLTYKLNLSLQKRHFYYYKNNQKTGDYNKSIVAGSFALGQQMRRLGTLSLQIQSEKINLKPTTGETTPQEKFTLRSITLRSEVDTRDRVPFPKMGKYHILEYETATRFIGSEVSYFKIFSSMESYYSLGRSFAFHPRIYWGTSDMTIPFAKQFQLGGLDSFLGLPEEALVGKRFITLNGELRYRIPWPRWLETYLSLRYDFGGIWGRYVKITTKDFKQGIGVILSFNTPLGPIYISYGHMSDGISHAYFSSGYRF